MAGENQNASTEGTPAKPVTEMNLYEKIAAARDEAKFVKDKPIHSTKTGEKIYDIWTEHSVMNVVIPLYQKYRMMHYRKGIKVDFVSDYRIKVTSKMVLVNLDNPDETILFCGVGTGSDDDDKDSGKASTYSVKDALLKLFMANTGIDPDIEGSEATLDILRRNAIILLDDLKKAEYFVNKAKKTMGTSATEKDINAEAARLYEGRKAQAQEGKIDKVRDMISNMNTVLKSLGR